MPLPILARREDFYRALGAFAFVQVVGALVFVALPSHMVRPSLAPDGAALLLLHWIYRVDGPWNIFPSLHVAHAASVALLLRVHRRRLFLPVALGSVLITASTVLVKQHYLLDIPAGALLAWVGFRALRLDRAPKAVTAAPSKTPRKRMDTLRRSLDAASNWRQSACARAVQG